MKNTLKFLGNLTRANQRLAKVPLVIIALIAIIGFSMMACDPENGNGNGNGDKCSTCSSEPCICPPDYMPLFIATFSNTSWSAVNIGIHDSTQLLEFNEGATTLTISGTFEETFGDYTTPVNGTHNIILALSVQGEGIWDIYFDNDFQLGFIVKSETELYRNYWGIDITYNKNN